LHGRFLTEYPLVTDKEFIMKPALFLSAIAACGALLIFESGQVAAEASPVHFAQQPQINTLLNIAIAPYKR